MLFLDRALGLAPVADALLAEEAAEAAAEVEASAGKAPGKGKAKGKTAKGKGGKSTGKR